MNKVTLSEAIRAPFNLEAYIMHTSPAVEVVHLLLQPDQVITQHSNSFDVVACLIFGDASMQMGEKNIPLSLYDVVEIEKNIERGFSNIGKSEARFLIIKKL